MFRNRGYLPIYGRAQSLDNCTFAAETLWTEADDSTQGFRFNRSLPAGRQYIGEAGELSHVVTGTYDYLLSCHALEHMANPVSVLLDWKTTLEPRGYLILIVPHKEGTFDHRRPTTTLEHLIADFENDTTEDDTTHIDEILRLHDFDRDPGAKSVEAFVERARHNVQNRGLHHHVFNGALVAQLLDYCRFKLEFMECAEPCHIIAVVRKTDTEDEIDNSAFLTPQAAFLEASPFPSDRQTS